MTRRGSTTNRSPCLTCGKPSQGPYCPQHGTTDKGYNRPHWKTIRTLRMNLANHRCELHLDPLCTGTATTVHLNPRLQGNHDHATIDDTRAACRHCHFIAEGKPW